MHVPETGENGINAGALGRIRARESGCAFRSPGLSTESLARPGGFEPPTLVPRSGDRVSTETLARPGGFEPPTLVPRSGDRVSTETLARPGGFEPPTLVPRSGDRVGRDQRCAPGRIRTTDFGSAFRRPGLNGIHCAPGRIRTTDFRFRRPTLYPTELRAPAAPLITMRGFERQSFGTRREIRLAGLCVLSHL
jgi:hypothetical protein